LDAASGVQRWIYESTVPVLSLRGTGAPLIAGNMALAGLASGKVVAVDVQRGQPNWEQGVANPQGRSELVGVVVNDR
ncbi:PQQ-binding-like beta-propeller repeat protein, partial [Pseudomonas aeruginosa]|uniref:outer membrane protein assembly factor BamB family protein n=1 Tax=Pseudomonas aeruginosa TaxID=287 RepID=UPI003CC52BEB